MGFFLSVLYLLTYYLTPTALFGPLAPLRIELILALLVVVASIPELMRSIMLRMPQTLALIGLGFAIFLSMLIGDHWGTGAVQALELFIPNCFAFFLLCLHCKTRKHLQILVLMLLSVCLFVIARGYWDITLLEKYNASPLAGVGTTRAALQGFEGRHGNELFVIAQQNSEGAWIYRLRGMGEIHDPNDVAQLIVSVIPLMFIFWRPKRILRNLPFVILPVCGLFFGAYLTHSRGFVVALLAMTFLLARRRFGIVPALVVAAGLFAASSALHFSGGRDISADSGKDRAALWGEGLQIVKSHPIFGVGFGLMGDHTDNHQTAHNSVVVCSAELGLFGLYFWSLFLLPSLRDALVIASPEKVSEAKPMVIEKSPFPGPPWKFSAVDKAEINNLGNLVFLSLIGFLVTGWFLSRAFVTTMFLLGGMAEVVYEMALRRGMVAPRLRLGRVAFYSGVFTISLLVLVYGMLRVLNLLNFAD